LHQVLDFINFILSRLKKGAKYLFEELSKLIDEIFGVGKKVEELPKTPSEKRVLEKRESQAKRLNDKRGRNTNKKDKKLRKELFSKIKGKPINKKLLKKLQEDFKGMGGDMIYNKESFEYIISREKTLGTEIEAITLGDDLIMLNKNVTTSAVYEELIHARQFKSGKYNEWANEYGNIIAENLMEKEAAEELLENAVKLKLPKDEINLIKERLNFFNNELKKLNYEN
jgi:hypothetical protein